MIVTVVIEALCKVMHTYVHIHISEREMEIVAALLMVNFADSLATSVYCFPFHVFIQRASR